MSLFDVLKYPVSIPPTEEELKAIPEAVYLEWVKHIPISNRISYNRFPSYYSKQYHRALCLPGYKQSKIIQIRKRIYQLKTIIKDLL